MLEEIRATPATGPWVVHCSAGIGRSGAIIAIDIATRILEFGGSVDTLDVIHMLRNDRCAMVQQPSQYELVHQACLFYAEAQNHAIEITPKAIVFGAAAPPEDPASSSSDEDEEADDLRSPPVSAPPSPPPAAQEPAPQEQGPVPPAAPEPTEPAPSADSAEASTPAPAAAAAAPAKPQAAAKRKPPPSAYDEVVLQPEAKAGAEAEASAAAAAPSASASAAVYIPAQQKHRKFTEMIWFHGAMDRQQAEEFLSGLDAKVR